MQQENLELNRPLVSDSFVTGKKKNIGVTIPGKWSFVVKSAEFHEIKQIL